MGEIGGTITAIGTVVSGLLIALVTLVQARQRRVIQDVDQLSYKVDLLQQQQGRSLGHVYELELGLRGAGLPVPDRPPELSPTWVTERMRARFGPDAA